MPIRSLAPTHQAAPDSAMLAMCAFGQTRIRSVRLTEQR
jgi:hypothetical protein